MEDDLYKKLKSKSKFSYFDVIEEKLFYYKIPPLATAGVFVKDKNLKDEEIPLVRLKYSTDKANSPIEKPIDFKLSLSEVIKDNSIINEYLNSFNEPENGIRQKLGLPFVGEGWISETNLFYEIKNHFKSDLVVHHGRPTWLGRQHLDIYMPDLNIAIEYQGDQHFKPIDFFGGKRALKKNKERDERKRELCEINGCALIYVYPNYELKDVLAKIKKELKR